ncbi:hypothetical protein M3212_15295 [Alkalihalobacillus oceani]|nr:hypothetical protein [Halalkalibacter oceani]MCM3762137.1 hypothetical protein [Halalkalibacter oceani]
MTMWEKQKYTEEISTWVLGRQKTTDLYPVIDGPFLLTCGQVYNSIR